VGLSGKDGNMVTARKVTRTVIDPGSSIEKIVDLGFVGEPETVDITVLNQIRERHEHVHQQVSPAVVAVESGQAKRGVKEGPKFYGTGVVISPDGLILTSSTVVPAATRFVQVYFSDGKVMEARVVAIEPGELFAAAADRLQSALGEALEDRRIGKSLPHLGVHPLYCLARSARRSEQAEPLVDHQPRISRLLIGRHVR